MADKATLRRAEGSLVLEIPDSIARSLTVDEGSVVDLVVEAGRLVIRRSPKTLAERLAESPNRPEDWPRDEAHLTDRPVGRELI